MDYNDTLNLPKSDFPMRGNLPEREPKMLDSWEKNDVYKKMIENNENKPLYVLHDGPPYANGDIHLGTALNKVLKDIVVKSKNMLGFKSPYKPGWDTHGLPIELKALKKDGVDPSTISPIELRKICHDFALMYVDNQRNQFKRLLVLGDYSNPYLTLTPDFEAEQIKIFGAMAKKDFIYKGLKPVYWCSECKTALAEAEIEYAQDPCHSIYVKFNVTDSKGIFDVLPIDKSHLYFVIWTTTTWTLPGNVAICLGPDFTYTVVSIGDEHYVIATDLVDVTMTACGIKEYTTQGSFLGKDLEGIVTAHPFLDRNSLVIVGEHVTLESGTGCVHTAPGHGVDDFLVCKNYPQLEVVVPVNEIGVLTELAGQFAGIKTDDANKVIAEHLQNTGHLLGIQKIIHQYPHCWRCSSPIIYRATEQWFCSIDGFKKEALEAVNGIEWIPGWGQKRIEGMIRDRSDWCISRQRVWGVPIPILYCKNCNKTLINDKTINAISELFRKEGSDAWYKRELSEFLPDIKCECGCTEFTKETDIMDVWFDSGSSHAAVLGKSDDLRFPADLYLEGADQYRGWFQSSLLTSVAANGVAPYKAVCTHGWVVDGEGKKQSKSLGNGINPDEIIKQYGADILRLWVASSDYHADIRISKDILKQLTESYRKIRNTAKYILGNLSDFNPDNCVSFNDLEPLDIIALHKLNNLVDKVNKAYNDFDFHIVYHSIHSFCVLDMSNFYLDIIKDRLYCEKGNSTKRCAAQTTMFIILDALTRMIAPILAFTADEIWNFMPHRSSDNAENVLYNDMITKVDINVDTNFVEFWDKIYAVREDVQKALEVKRTQGLIGKSLEAKVTLFCDDKLADILKNTNLATLFICSKVEVMTAGDGEFKGDTVCVTVTKATGAKCDRCWIYSDECDTDTGLCKRCAEVLK